MNRKVEEEFDEAFPDGVFAFPPNPKDPKVKLRALGDYCKERGITPNKLTEDEIEQFLVVD
ncbi:hypothetical protein [Metabacillus litoralis]|uniref:hypothetical protein n=1 Tax=Metabacillus litoralis TaxID=152268 RepID=UPI000EF5D534|nr:hypothetical protein [Metabacillus litoralis]